MISPGGNKTPTVSCSSVYIPSRVLRQTMRAEGGVKGKTSGAVCLNRLESRKQGRESHSYQTERKESCKAGFAEQMAYHHFIYMDGLAAIRGTLNF